VRIQGADLNLFEFDYDCTWFAFMLNADEHIYGRYGGRDAKGPDDRMSLAGFRFSLQAALDAHQQVRPASKPRNARAFRVDDYPAAKGMERGCIHCHQTWEYRRSYLKSQGKWSKDEVWVYPLPENIGLTLEIDRGNHVLSVAKNSPADRAGVRAGDAVKTINSVSIASFADASYALHKSPAEGAVSITWEHDGKTQSANLALAAGWRRTNVTWRPSMLDILPSISLSGEDLSAAEKKSLGLAPARLAFRQDAKVHKSMADAGVRSGDVIVGVDSQELDMSMTEFFAYIRRNYLIGEKVQLNVVRNGKKVDLPLTLK
jgi:predicted metalloprotease with PDZ domain